MNTIIRINIGKRSYLMTLDRAMRLLLVLALGRRAVEPRVCEKCGK